MLERHVDASPTQCLSTENRGLPGAPQRQAWESLLQDIMVKGPTPGSPLEKHNGNFCKIPLQLNYEENNVIRGIWYIITL